MKNGSEKRKLAYCRLAVREGDGGECSFVRLSLSPYLYIYMKMIDLWADKALMKPSEDWRWW